MMARVAKNTDGFTLIEFLMALLIISVGLLGLLETLGVSMKQNLSNKMRTDAISIADQHMAVVRVTPIADLADSDETKKLGFVNYSVVREVENAGTSSRSVSVRIKWRDRGLEKQYSLTSIVSP